MYYSRSHSNHNYKHKKKFPWVIFIVLFFIFGGSPLFFFVVVIFLLKSVAAKNSSSSSTNRMPPRGKDVPVEYVDRLEPHEDPENFTRERAYCFECGTAVGTSAEYCTFCGTNLI